MVERQREGIAKDRAAIGLSNYDLIDRQSRTTLNLRMGNAISPRGDMLKHRVLLHGGTPHVCHQHHHV